MIEQSILIIYDGDCMVCNKFIQWVLLHDHNTFLVVNRNSIRIAEFVDVNTLPPTSVDSIFVIKDKEVLIKAKAIRCILSKTTLMGKVGAFILKWIPIFISNIGYDLFAKYRHHFINNNTCSIISNKEIRSRMIL